MNWAFAGKLLLALFAAGVVGAWAGGDMGSAFGIFLPLAVVYAENEKQKRK